MAHRKQLQTPTPNPSPQGGGEFTEFVALLCIDLSLRRRAGCELAPEHEVVAQALDR